jgi:hypothetical protein
MKGPGEKRTRQQEAAIVALLTAPTLTEAALQAGISEPTLRRWLQRDDFQTAYREARRALMSQAMARLQQVTGTAITTLEAIMGDAEATSSSRVSAARAVLELAVKVAELDDLEARVTALEAALQQRRQRYGA